MIMKTRLILLVALALVAGGCASQGPTLPARPKVQLEQAK